MGRKTLQTHEKRSFSKRYNITNMSQEDIEETIETTEDTTSVEETQETNTQSGSLEETNKRLYARTKAAEEEAKKLREELNKKSQVDSNPVEADKADFDPFETIELINTLKDFSNEELSFIKTVAKGSGKSLKEAAMSEDVKTYVEAMREKIRKDNLTLDPSNKHSNPNLTAEDALAKGDFKSLSLEEKERMIKEADAKYRKQF